MNLKRKKIHINITKRNASKYITTIEGLDEIDIDKGIKHLLKRMKKNFCCNGSLDKNHENDEVVIKMQGDQRENIKNYLIKKYEFNEEDIIVHGV